MTNEDQTEAFNDTLDASIDRFTQEFDLTYASVIGVLVMKVVELTLQSGIHENNDQEDDQESD
jgi:hypothetical protein